MSSDDDRVAALPADPYNSPTGLKGMTTVLVFGTFDVLHSGHRWFLKKAARKGDRLVAVVSRDDFVKNWKGRQPLMHQEARMEALMDSGLVDEVFLADPEIRTYGVLKLAKPDVICLGHDQKSLMDDLVSRSDVGGSGTPRIEVLPPWRRHRYSSTRLNKALGGVEGREERFGSWGLIALTVLAMTAFGFSWVSGKRISGTAAPPVLAFLRFLLTTACFIPFLFVRKSPRPPGGRLIRGLAWSVAAAIAITAYNLLFFLGLESGLAGKGGLIVTTLNPLFTFVIASAFSGTRPGASAALGIAVGIGGGILLMEPWAFSAAEFTDSSNLAFLAAALCWSLLTLTGRKAQGFMGFGPFNASLYVFASLFTLPFALPGLDRAAILSYGPPFWFDLAFIAVVVGAFGTGVYFVASSRLGAARGSSFTYLVPVSALAFTAILLKERPQPVMILGGIFAVLAVALINKRRNQ